MGDEVTAAEEFWLALARNDRAGAQAVVDRLDIPLVTTMAFSFEEVDGEAELERPPQGAPGGQADERGMSFSPKSVSADTPVAAIEAWNLDDRVLLLLLCKSEICGARVSDGEVDFLACAGALDCVGGTSCGWATHKTGGKDAKRHQVLKMDLPEGLPTIDKPLPVH